MPAFLCKSSINGGVNVLTYYSPNNTVAIANKNKNRKQHKRNTHTKTKTHRETRKGSRAVKYFHQPRLSGEEDGEPKGQQRVCDTYERCTFVA